MVGLSHVGLRLLVRRYLPAGAVTTWPTEMLSSWRLAVEELGATPETFYSPEETHLVPQILGNEEEPIRKAVERLQDWGAVGVDINMGCPVSKALRHNYGVALMGDADYAAQVVRMTVRHARVPVSVKLRAGLQSDVDYLLKFVEGLQEAGAAWITLHPRVGAMKRRGAADWSQIGLVRKHLGIPVVGNGDVQCVEDVFALLEQTECDAVMVGRALAARPWMMWQLGERLGWGPPAFVSGAGADRLGFVGGTGSTGIVRAPVTPEEEGAEYGRACLYLIDVLEKYFAWPDACKRFRFHVRMTQGWLEFGQHFFSLVTRAQDFASLREAVHGFFAQPQCMVSRTQLRE